MSFDLQEIELSKTKWGFLFEPYLFFESYKNYLQVDIVAVDSDDLRAWKGWVESRLRQLTLMVTSVCFELCVYEGLVTSKCITLDKISDNLLQYTL